MIAVQKVIPLLPGDTPTSRAAGGGGGGAGRGGGGGGGEVGEWRPSLLQGARLPFLNHHQLHSQRKLATLVDVLKVTEKMVAAEDI